MSAPLHPNQEANAVGHTPELLERLCDIVACHKRTESCHHGDDFHDACDDLTNAIEKAIPLIAKAKGVQ